MFARVAAFVNRSTKAQPVTRKACSPSYSSTSEATSDAFITTLEEDEQQLLIALFYWRRKVIESHFSAWKWVVFSLQKAAKRQQVKFRNQERSQQHHAYVRNSRAQSKEHRDSVLHSNRPVCRLHPSPSSGRIVFETRHAERAQPVQEVNRKKHDELVASLKRKYRNMKQNDEIENKMTVQLPTPESPSRTMPTTDKRRDFRDYLYLVYRAFSMWKATIVDLQHRRSRIVAEATNVRKKRVAKRALRTWKTCVLLLQFEEKALVRADRMNAKRVKRKCLQRWNLYSRISAEVERRYQARLALRLGQLFQCWRLQLEKQRRCDRLRKRRRRRLCQHAIASLQQFAGRQNEKRCLEEVAVSFWRKRARRSFLSAWKQYVLASPNYLLSLQAARAIAVLSAIRKWRRYMHTRQQGYHRKLQADVFRGVTCAHYFFKRWRSYHSMKTQQKDVQDSAHLHYERHVQRVFIRQLVINRRSEETKKEKDRTASKWRQATLQRKVVIQWQRNAALSSQLCRFQRRRNHRLQQECFDSWLRCSVDSANVRKKQTALMTHRSRILLGKSVTMWMDAYRVNVWISSRQRKRRVLQLISHFSAWRSFVASQVRLDSRILCFQIDWQANHVRTIIAAWTGETLRRRCYRRLVQLFLRKTSRKHMKQMFKELVLHTKANRFQRRRCDAKQRQAVWCWTRFYHERRYFRVQRDCSDQLYSSRRCSEAVTRWKTNNVKMKWKREAEYKALSYRFQGMLKKSLHAWYIVARSRIRQTVFMESRRLHRASRKKREYFRAWYGFVRRNCKLKVQEKVALKLRADKELVRYFCPWIVYYEKRKQKRQRLGSAIAKCNVSACSKSFELWQRYTWRSSRERQQRLFVYERTRRHRTQAALTKWRRRIQQEKRHRMQETQASAFFREFLLYSAFYCWYNELLCRAVGREKHDLTRARILSLRLARAVASWKRVKVVKSRLKAGAHTAAKHFDRKQLKKGICLWMSSHQTKRLGMRKWNAAILYSQQKRLKTSYLAWICYCKSRHALKATLQSVFRSDSASLLCDAFSVWKQYRNKKTLHQIAQAHCRSSLMRKAWLIWQSHRSFVVKMKANVLVTSRLLKSNLVKLIFFHWSVYVAARKHRQELLFRSEQCSSMRQYKRAIQRFKRRHKYLLLVANAQAVWKQSRLTSHFVAWKQHLLRRKSARVNKTLADCFQRSTLTQRSFTRWTRVANRSIEEKCEKADKFDRIVSVRRAWEVWTCAVLWERKVRATQTKHLGYLLADSYRKWMAFVQRRRISAEKRADAVSHAHGRMCRKSWIHWKQFVAMRRQKHQLLFRALSFYSTFVLQRRCFEAWIAFQGVQASEREKRHQARLLGILSSTRHTFGRWTAYLDRRRDRTESKAAELISVKRHLWSRSILKWRSRTIESRRQTKNLVHSSRFYRQTCAQKGVDALRSWVGERKAFKGRVDLAKKSRERKAVQRCFQQWCDQHLWRLKYQRFLKFFRDNQQGDFFARWKVYTRETKRAREMKSQADDFKHSHTMQQFFQRWGEFAHMNRLREKAIKHNCAKTTVQTFCSWKSKIRVLKQMRKMFLFQDSFCLENHFGAWKRFRNLKRHQMARFQRATAFMNKSRTAKCWDVWMRWILLRRQEKETIQLAIGFRQRFFSCKCFRQWEAEMLWRRRKKVIAALANQHVDVKRLRNALNGLIQVYVAKRALLQLQRMVERLISEKRQTRVLERLQLLQAESKRWRAKTIKAATHCQYVYQRRYWHSFQQWHSRVKIQNGKLDRAAQHADTATVRRGFQRLVDYGSQMKRLRSRVSRFRVRYFRSMGDECFHRWKRFVRLKSKLRVFVRSRMRSQRRQILHHWHRRVSTISQQRVSLNEFSTRRQHRQLVACLEHWESVITDTWIHNRLIEWRRNQNAARTRERALGRWKQLVVVRRAWKKWRQRSLQRHKQWLCGIIQLWRQCAERNERLTDRPFPSQV